MIGVARSTQRYVKVNKNDDGELRLAMIRLAKQYGRYGYRKIVHLLRIEGWTVNHKKIERLWRDSRLERIWEGTSEIQRHIISRSLLRPLGA